MCGIAGIISDGDTRELQPRVAHMMELLAHRGPDDEGLWQEADVCLGHRRLSILDLSPAGRQPFHYMNGRYVVVFNGEIYNYIELREELAGKGYEFRTKTDTEIIPAAYDCYGSDCVNRFNGMWAFALWDRVEQKLFASRDRFGKKPFYYVNGPAGFVFASEIKAAIAGSGIDAAPNMDRIYDFALSRRLDHTSETMFQGVRQLPPAHNLFRHGDRLRLERYWHLRPTRNRTIGPAVIEEVRDLFKDSVRLRLRSDVPVGCALSGGIDSSAVTCMAATLRDSANNGPLTAFTVRVQHESSEAAVLPGIYERFDLKKVESWPDATSFWNDMEEVIWRQEEPFGDGTMVSHFDIMRQARRNGVPVVLGGQGGDEIFVGYDSQVWALLGEYLRHCRLIALYRSLPQYSQSQGYNTTHGIAHALWHAVPSFLQDRLAAWLEQSRIAWLDKGTRTFRFRYPAEKRPWLPYFDNYLLNVVQRWTLPGFLHYEDRNAMAFGVETRAPFLDYRLAELLFSLNPEAKVNGALTKYALRMALRDIVPASVLSRCRKESFPSPLADWLRARRERVMAIISDSRTRNIPFVYQTGLRVVADRFFQNPSEPVDAIWRALCIILWHDRLIARSGEYKRIGDEAPIRVRSGIGLSRRSVAKTDDDSGLSGNSHEFRSKDDGAYVNAPEINAGRRACLVMRAPLPRYPSSIFQAQMLHEAGVNVSILDCEDGGYHAVSVSDGVERHVVGRTDCFGNMLPWVKPINRLDFARSVSRQLRGLAPDLIVVYEPPAFAALRRIAARKKRDVVYVLHFHEYPDAHPSLGWGTRRDIAFAREHSNEADMVIFPDRHRAELFASEVRLIKEPVVVMNCPRRLESPPRDNGALWELLRRQGFPQERIVLYNGAAGPGHGIKLTVESMADWPKDSLYVIVGPCSDAYRAEILALAERFGVGNRVAILGTVAPDEMWTVRAGADIALTLMAPTGRNVVNYRYAAGASNKRFEAMAAGLAQITNKGPGVDEIVERTGCGITVAIDSRDELSEAVRYLLNNDAARREMGECGRKIHLAEFNYEKQFAPALSKILWMCGRGHTEMTLT